MGWFVFGLLTGLAMGFFGGYVVGELAGWRKEMDERIKADNARRDEYLKLHP